MSTTRTGTRPTTALRTWNWSSTTNTRPSTTTRGSTDVATDSTSAMQNEPPAQSGCERCAELEARNAELLRALQRADSRLSLLRHRGGIAWGSLGIGDASEYDEVIGQARRLLEQAGTEHAR